ncbi:hypothetical protein [Halarsenatibacter silvermanii]|uniref:Na+-translocating ferredoxin:NAD+ oxidoreductase RNF, RnfA subunit n=1 Tax=Halarsenatibacter silvermanii TaxID=321763 RepID=A0A1G9NZU3_9FIRM|nr:hypothetical protein [Halarsenatibacter silvermanii]SDL92106.1 Na+-translocating ferredoxin:NAD+ oxidoreductase RNF, RnfA subunit [Halarsenatibacter silvermanii]
MSELFGIFLENIIPQNIIFAYFLGVLISLVETAGVRRSLIKGVKFSLGLFFAAIVGTIIAASLPLELEFAHGWIFLLTALGAVFVLQKTGEFQGEFLGVPRFFLMLAPLVGLQYILVDRGLSVDVMLITALANSIGFYFGFILIGTIKEQVRISEADEIYKYVPTLLISLGVLGMIIKGFAFLY